jgi:acyl-CoA reductase-like NAD-dependent aldehyde dehydrogenase
VALASDSELGLEGWVLTDGVGRSEPVVDRGDNGTVLVNQVIWTPRPRLFGSITTAVHGPELSSTGIEEAGSSVRIGALHDHA